MTISTDVTTRDDCVLTMLEESGGMIMNFARKHHLEFDECYQHASLLMLEVWPKIPDGYNVKAYLNATVRRGLQALLHHLLQRDIDALSLDMLFMADDTSFLDILEASENRRTEDEIVRLEKTTEVVHSALQQCWIEEQEYACKAFELPDYIPVPPVNRPAFGRKKREERRTDNMLRSIRRVFHKNEQVQGLLQRETYVL
jgi:hypothetical protein